MDTGSPTAARVADVFCGQLDEVRLLHLSDTHSMHRSIEARFPLPPADVLLHTGDFTNHGSAEEFADFNAWLGELRPRYKHILVILGNHDWWFLKDPRWAAHFEKALAPGFAKRLLSNATVLEHELVEVLGLKIFGSTWCPWHLAGSPGDPPLQQQSHIELLVRDFWRQSGGRLEHRFNEIPAGVDLLLTHGAPFGILDELEGTGHHWGGSQVLLVEILRSQPRAHLFGHIHEQRGFWRRRPDGAGFEGGVEYRPSLDRPWTTFPPPPPAYPCDLVACGAMANHPGLEHSWAEIVAPGRLVVARRLGAGPWSFDLPLSGHLVPPR